LGCGQKGQCIALLDSQLFRSIDRYAPGSLDVHQQQSFIGAQQKHDGPNLAGLWKRKAGISPALASSDIIWDDKTLDAWLANPQHVIAGNTMTFPGIGDPQQRADLLAFLKQATEPGQHERCAAGSTDGQDDDGWRTGPQSQKA